MSFQLDTKSGVPIYRQIIEQVKYTIARGELEPGDRLPTVRQLAVDLSVNPNTVVRAYRELEIAGVLDTQQGSGTFVGKERPEIAEKFARASEHYKENPVALHLRAMNMVYEGPRQKGSMIIVPSSAVETMGLGALGGLTAFGQTAAGTAGQASEPPSPEPGSDTQG